MQTTTVRTVWADRNILHLFRFKWAGVDYHILLERRQRNASGVSTRNTKQSSATNYKKEATCPTVLSHYLLTSCCKKLSIMIRWVKHCAEWRVSSVPQCRYFLLQKRELTLPVDHFVCFVAINRRMSGIWPPQIFACSFSVIATLPWIQRLSEEYAPPYSHSSTTTPMMCRQLQWRH